MWLFLVTEIMFFGGMFCAYLVYRLAHFKRFCGRQPAAQHQDGSLQHRRPDRKFGHGVLAVKAAEVGKRKLLVGYLVVTVLLA